MFLVYGIAMLLPWNSNNYKNRGDLLFITELSILVFITASDFFYSRFDTYHSNDFQNYFSAYFNCSNLISLTVLLFIRRPIHIEIPLWLNFVIFSFFAITALLTPIISPVIYFWITIGCMVLTGVTTSLLQACIVAEASQVSPKYMQAIMR